MLAVVIAVTLWLETTKESKVVVFTDSESVRGSVLKSWSANVSSDKLLSRLFLLEQAMSYPLWFERVPSQSNVADSFSREEVQSAGQLRADKVEVESVLRSAAITWGEVRGLRCDKTPMEKKGVMMPLCEFGLRLNISQPCSESR